MVEFSESLEINREVLMARFDFLSKRAEWHLGRPDYREHMVPAASALHLACAATLRRDAGAIAVLLGRMEQARSEFTAAGNIRLQLGFYDGLYLLRLSETSSTLGARAFGDVLPWIERSLSGDEREREGLPPFATAASRSPRQLISVLQAASAMNSPLGEVAELASERLQIYAAYLLGVTQTPVERYIKLFSELRRGELGDGRKTLIGMSLKREELIAAAQRDKFHWRLAQKPADLIDMDMLALGLSAIERDEDLFEHVRSIAEEFGPTVQVPFDAARLLRTLPPRSTPPRSATL